MKKQKQSNPDAARRALRQRSCVGCGARKPQRELLRVASQAGSTPGLDKQGLDKKGKAPGRGAYVCADGACIERARKRRAFERALKLRASVPRELWDEIEKLIFDL